MDVVTLIVSLISGLVGGNIVGLIVPARNLSELVNTSAGLIGGGISAFVLKVTGMIAATTTISQTENIADLDFVRILMIITISGIAGAILVVTVAFISYAMQKK